MKDGKYSQAILKKYGGSIEDPFDILWDLILTPFSEKIFNIASSYEKIFQFEVGWRNNIGDMKIYIAPKII
jgi:hypothetical protein